MRISTVMGFAITTMSLMIFGILSLTKPNLIGSDINWVKYNWIHVPKYKKSTNEYYHNQIKLVGVGLIASSVLMLVITVSYIINPEILLFLKIK